MLNFIICQALKFKTGFQLPIFSKKLMNLTNLFAMKVAEAIILSKIL